MPWYAPGPGQWPHWAHPGSALERSFRAMGWVEQSDGNPDTPTNPPDPAAARMIKAINGKLADITGGITLSAGDVGALDQTAGDARYPRKGDLVFNVRDYGAKGDGTTNDNAAIHVARDAAGVGGRLYFPAGTYRVAGLLANIAKQKWELHPNAVIKAVDGATASVIDIRAAEVTITGGTVDGNRPNVPSSNVVGIYSGSVIKDTKILGVTVQSCTGYGIWLMDNSGYRIQDCTVTDTALTGIITQASTVNVARGTVRGNTVDRGDEPLTLTSAGIQVRGGGGFTQAHAKVRGNHVTMPARPSDPGNHPICIELQARDSTATGNTTLNGAMGISLTGCARTAVTGNTIYGPASGATQQYGIEVANSPHCTIAGNTIDGLDACSEGIGLSQNGSTDVAITGNTVRQTTGSGINVSGGCPRAAISGNVVYTTTGRGITVANGSGDAAVTGNVLNGNASGGATEGIRVWSLSSAVAGVIASGNRIMGFPKGIAVVGAAALVTDRLLVVGNDFTGCVTPWSETYTGGASLGTDVRIRSNLALADN